MQLNQLKTQKISTRINNKEVDIDPDEICYCHADGCYTWLFMDSGKSFLISKPIKWLAEQLQEKDFMQCHRSYLVNISKIKFIDFKERMIIQELYQIPISYRNFTNIIYKCNDYIKIGKIAIQ